MYRISKTKSPTKEKSGLTIDFHPGRIFKRFFFFFSLSFCLTTLAEAVMFSMGNAEFWLLSETLS